MPERRWSVGGPGTAGPAGARLPPAPDPGDHAAGGDVDGHIDVAVGRRGHTAGLDRPRAERDRAVPARGGVAVLVPEQHAEVRTLVVRRHEKAAVHVGVPARLVAEEPPDPVDLVGARGAAAGTPPLRLRTPLSPRGVPRGSPPVSRAARTPWPALLPRSR